jgi:hypothetical protein
LLAAVTVLSVLPFNETLSCSAMTRAVMIFSLFNLSQAGELLFHPLAC